MDGGLSWGWRALSWPAAQPLLGMLRSLLLSMSPENPHQVPLWSQAHARLKGGQRSKQVGPTWERTEQRFLHC